MISRISFSVGDFKKITSLYVRMSCKMYLGAPGCVFPLFHEMPFRKEPPFSSICALFNFSSRGVHETRHNVEMRSTVRLTDCYISILVHSVFLV